MSGRGWNLRRGAPDGDKGRRLGGVAHSKMNTQVLDDSGRTLAQYWATVQWFNLVAQVGRAEAGRIMGRRGELGWMAEREAYSRYLGEMRLYARHGLLMGLDVEYWIGGRPYHPWLYTRERLFQAGVVVAHRWGVISIKWTRLCPEYMPRAWNITEKELAHWLNLGVLRFPIEGGNDDSTE